MTRLLIGVVTWYSAATGDPLYCGGEYTSSQQWLALPVEMYQGGETQCGDMFAIWQDGNLMYLPALDAGGFGPYCVRDEEGECHDIIADLPRHVYPTGEGRSFRGYIINSQRAREEMVR